MSVLLDGDLARRWAGVCRIALAAHRARIDALNVYPVPDGDTGTNMYLTFDAAVEHTRAEAAARGLDVDVSDHGRTAPIPLGAAAAAFAKAMVMTGRGNSGVILAQFVGGLASSILESMTARGGDPHRVDEGIDAAELAAALERAATWARRAVAEPVEGTMLTLASAVATAVADRAARDRADAGRGFDLDRLAQVALDTARVALARTREQLPVLAEAGVVDAGAAGLLLLFESFQRVLAGEDTSTWLLDDTEHPPGPSVWTHACPTYGGPAYEVMCHVLGRRPPGEAAGELERRLREALGSLGDSVVVGGFPGVVSVHVHADDPAEALEAVAGIAGPHAVSDVRITRLTPMRDAPDTPHRARAVLACAMGAGLSQTLRAAGATVVESGPGRRTSTGALVEAARLTGARQITLLPNDPDTRLTADAARRVLRQEGIEVEVVATKAIVQGLAALAVHDETRPFAEDVAAMRAAGTATRYGAVSVATRRAHTSAGPCRAGDVLGFVSGRIRFVGSDPATVAGQVVRGLLTADSELLTVVRGASAPQSLAEAVAAAARMRRRDVEVSFVDGGQPVYTLLLGVE